MTEHASVYNPIFYIKSYFKCFDVCFPKPIYKACNVYMWVVLSLSRLKVTCTHIFFKDTDLCVQHVSTESLTVIESNVHFVAAD